MKPDETEPGYRAELDRLLASKELQRTPALARLLTHLVEQVLAGDGESLKEVVIGYALYQRPVGYDPQLDSVVRVNANRLRIRLEEHYRVRPQSPVRIVLPKGSYVPVLEVHRVERLSAPNPDAEGSVAPTSGSVAFGGVSVLPSPLWTLGGGGQRKRQVVFFSTVVGAAVLCALFWMAARRPAIVVAETRWSVRPFARLGGSQQFGDFSPDGQSLAFTSTSTADFKKAIYIQGIASDEARRLTSGIRPVWSPDGKRLAFLREEQGGKKKVLVYELATGEETTVAEIEGRWPWLCVAPHLSWNPNGNTLYTSASAKGESICGLVAIDVSTHQISALTKPNESSGDLEAAVSPDGNSIAFLRGQGLETATSFCWKRRAAASAE